jgi:hypothetical protein
MTSAVECIYIERRLADGTWVLPAFDARYTDATVPVVDTVGAVTFDPLSWVRSDLSSSVIAARGDLLITLPAEHGFPQALIAPEEPYRVSVYRATDLSRDVGHIDAGDVTRIAIALVSLVRISGSTAEITCRSARSLLERIGPRQRIGPSCRHALYDVGCGVVAATYQDSGDVTDVTSTTITTSTPALSSTVGALVAGFATVGSAVRLIVSNDGAGVVVVDRPFAGDIVGETIVCVPGCNRHVTDCDSKFSNLANFGGIPNVTQTPFGGTSVNPFIRNIF